MKKFKLDEKYTTISIYILLLIAFALLFSLIVFNIGTIFSFIGFVFSKIACLFYGIFFTFCFLPFVKFIEKKLSKKGNKFNKSRFVSFFSVIFVDIFFIAILALALVGIVPSFIKAYNQFETNVTPQIKVITEKIHNSDKTLLIHLYDSFYSFIENQLTPGNAGALVTTLSTYFTAIASQVYQMGLGIVLASYFLICRSELSKLSNKFFTAIFSNNFRTSFNSILSRIYSYFVEFFSYRLINGVILGVLIFLLSLIFRLPYGIIIAVLTFILSFIPVFGPIVCSIGSSTIIAILTDSSYKLYHSLAYFIILTVAFTLSSLFFDPMFLQRKLRPGPGIVVTSVLVSYAFFGILGIVFAVPLYASFNYTSKELTSRTLIRKNLPIQSNFYIENEYLPINDEEEIKKGPEVDKESNIQTSTIIEDTVVEDSNQLNSPVPDKEISNENLPIPDPIQEKPKKRKFFNK